MIHERSRSWGLLRAAVLLGACAAMCLLWIGRRVHARGERLLIDLGEHMMQYAGADHQSEPQPLVINGAQLFVRSGSVSAPVSAVLDHFQAQCRARSGQLHEQWSAAAARRELPPPGELGILDGVFRSDSAEAGAIACFESGSERV